jgi:hypothetical protein
MVQKMKAKFINESLSDYLKPKSEEEISQSICKLDASELMNLGISHENPECIKLSIDKGADLDEFYLDVMINDPKWKDLVEYYIKKLEERNIIKAIRVSIMTKQNKNNIINLINKVDNLGELIENPRITFNYNYADQILRTLIYYSDNINLISEVYKKTKIKNNLKNIKELSDFLLRKIQDGIIKLNINILDLILTNG